MKSGAEATFAIDWIALVEMQESAEELGKRNGMGRQGTGNGPKKKWGLVIAEFAIRSPVPRSALFLK
jgi:hypothetical protein